MLLTSPRCHDGLGDILTEVARGAQGLQGPVTPPAWDAVGAGHRPRQAGEARGQGGQPGRGGLEEGLADVLQVAALGVGAQSLTFLSVTLHQGWA